MFTQPSQVILHNQLSVCVLLILRGRMKRLRHTNVVWPILHVPTFMKAWDDTTSRDDASFVTLVASIISLSSRYTEAARLTPILKENIRLFASRTVMASLTSAKANLYLVQALFHMSVVQEGTANPSFLWTYLSPALSYVRF